MGWHLLRCNVKAQVCRMNGHWLELMEMDWQIEKDDMMLQK